MTGGVYNLDILCRKITEVGVIFRCGSPKIEVLINGAMFRENQVFKNAKEASDHGIAELTKIKLKGDDAGGVQQSPQPAIRMKAPEPPANRKS
jgi:hypothetical protein